MRIVMLALLVGCQTAYIRGDSRPRNVSCKVEVRDAVIASGDPVRVRVTLTNAGPSHVWVGRVLDTVNSEWIVDGTDEEARTDPAFRAAMQGSGGGTVFSGPTGEGPYGREAHVGLEPKRSRSIELDVVGSLSGSTHVASGVDISDHRFVRELLAKPGTHELQLIVKSYPVGQMIGPGYDHEWPPWRTACNPVRVEVR